ncbi:MAG: DUF2520 domain-containing protein [Pseudobdellovibrio sp.]
MTQKNHTILIIGSGKLARHLFHWLRHLELTIQLTIHTWNRSLPLSNLYENLEKVDAVWLAISDQSISEFYTQHLSHFNKKYIHFSGSYHHDKIDCIHPLMTFSDQLYEKTFYSKIYLTTFGDKNLQDLAPFLSNPNFKVSLEHKKIYHALCVVSGNVPQMIWSKTFELIRANNVFSESDYDQAFAIFWNQSLVNLITNLRQNHSQEIVTGPIVRNDSQTIKDNLNALQRNTFLKTIYESALNYKKD